MSLNHSFCKPLLGAMLFGGRTHEIERLLSRFSQPEITQVLREEEGEKDEKEP